MVDNVGGKKTIPGLRGLTKKEQKRKSCVDSEGEHRKRSKKKKRKSLAPAYGANTILRSVIFYFPTIDDKLH
jgi:ribosome assembly protein YihI (activator of Der GTPase)